MSLSHHVNNLIESNVTYVNRSRGCCRIMWMDHKSTNWGKSKTPNSTDHYLAAFATWKEPTTEAESWHDWIFISELTHQRTPVAGRRSLVNAQITRMRYTT